MDFGEKMGALEAASVRYRDKVRQPVTLGVEHRVKEQLYSWKSTTSPCKSRLPWLGISISHMENDMQAWSYAIGKWPLRIKTTYESLLPTSKHHWWYHTIKALSRFPITQSRNNLFIKPETQTKQSSVKLEIMLTERSMNQLSWELQSSQFNQLKSTSTFSL